MNASELKGVGVAHAKIILGGEHSVVYGKPAIVLPVPLEVRAVTQADGKQALCKGSVVLSIKSKVFEGSSLYPPKELKGFFDMIFFIQDRLKIKDGEKSILVTIDSKIPLGAGLGSSAAVAIAVAKSIYDFYKFKMNQEQLFEAVHLAERNAHGNPSGLDMLGAFYNQPLFFSKVMKVNKENDQRDLKFRDLYNIEFIHPEKQMTFVIALSGVVVETSVVVAKVSEYLKQNSTKMDPLLLEFEKVVISMSNQLRVGDIQYLGEEMNKNHELLSELGTSSPILNQLVRVASESGAIGCKLSGKGIGGAVIALANSPKEAQHISDELKKNGATKCYIYNVHKNISEAVS